MGLDVVPVDGSYSSLVGTPCKPFVNTLYRHVLTSGVLGEDIPTLCNTSKPLFKAATVLETYLNTGPPYKTGTLVRNVLEAFQPTPGTVSS